MNASIKGNQKVNKKFASEFAVEWIESWNAHDLERIVSHYAGELEFKSPLIVERYSDPAGTIYSREKLREYFALGLKKNPSLSFKLIEMALGVDGLTLYYENARGGKTAEYFEFDTEGKVVKVIACYT